MSQLSVTPNDPTAATANRLQLQAAQGLTKLPKGFLHTAGPFTLSANSNGLNLVGRGETVIATTEILGGQLARSALLAPPNAISSRGDETPEARGDVLPAGQVGWHFDGDDSQAVGGVVTRILPGEAIPSTLEFIRAYSAEPFTGGRSRLMLANGHGFAAGDIVWATDGPTINEVLAEFRIVVSATATSITLDRPLQRTYRQGALVRGDFPARQRFTGMTLRGQLGTMLLFNCMNLTFSDVVLAKPPDFPVGDANNRLSVLGCGGIDLLRCDLSAIDGIGLSHGHDTRIIGCNGNGIMGEQDQITTSVIASRFNWLDGWQNCHRWTITDSDFAGGPEMTLGIYDFWAVKRVTCRGTVRVRGQGAKVTRLRTNGTLAVNPSHPAQHALSAKGVVLKDCEAATIELWPGSSGKIINCTGTIVGQDADKANWTRDGVPLA